MGHKPRLVANVLTHNELVYLQNLIPQLAPIFDRIIVVDDCSTDGTMEYLDNWRIVERVERKFDCDFSAQRNVALNMVDDGDWVFRIDSDEVLTKQMMLDMPGMIREFERIKVDRTQVTIYHLVSLGLCKQIVGKEVRLFKKNPSCHYAKRTHEEMRADFVGSMVNFPAWYGLIHFKYLDAQKIHLARTFSVENNLYDKADLEKRINEDFSFLPPFVEYEINDELKTHLCTQTL